MDKLDGGSLKAGWKGGKGPTASCTDISAFPSPGSLAACAAVGLVLPAQEGGTACSHPRAALGPTHIPS